MGAKLACNLKDNNICTKYEAERLLAFTNNSGPLFIISTVRNIYVL
jgi:nucleoside recognition membrane protein YjiH